MYYLDYYDEAQIPIRDQKPRWSSQAQSWDDVENILRPYQVSRDQLGHRAPRPDEYVQVELEITDGVICLEGVAGP